MFWLLVIAAIAFAAGGSSRSEGSESESSPGIHPQWSARLAVLRPGMERLEAGLRWPGLADFLTVTASQETWGRVDISGDGGLARGPYALHTTASTLRDLAALGWDVDGPEFLPPDVYTAAAAVHAGRLLSKASYNYPRADARWSDVRAGWAIPAFTGDRQAAPLLGKVRSEVVARHERRARLLGLASEPNALAQPTEYPSLTDALSIVLANGESP